MTTVIYTRPIPTFEDAMKWWKSKSETIQHNIRNLSINRLAKQMKEMGCEGQGIGSSDTNHAVYSMYCEYVNVMDKYDNLILFLFDYANDY